MCEESPCPEGTECVEDPRENQYSCVCAEGKKGKCSGRSSCTPSALWLSVSRLTLVCCPPADGHSLTFGGSSYVKYHLMENENKELMKLSLRLRTFSSHATVMYAKGTDYSILEVGVTSPQGSRREMIPPQSPPGFSEMVSFACRRSAAFSQALFLPALVMGSKGQTGSHGRPLECGSGLKSGYFNTGRQTESRFPNIPLRVCLLRQSAFQTSDPTRPRSEAIV